MKNIIQKIRFISKIFLIILGCFAALLIILAFTTTPFWIWYRYSTKYAGINRPPEYIILLGGGGMPSESGLIRSWYAAKTASHFSKALVIISLPGDTTDSLSSVNQMKKEMILRGIDQTRIILEPIGTNTRAQALQIKNLVNSHPLTLSPSILIVTSPEHLTRAVLTFKNAGFLKVDGLPAFETTIESDITYNDRLMGGRKWIPGIGGNLSIRYHFWTQLRYEELMIREFLAIFYYRLKGWI